MKFEPKTEKEIAEANLWPLGTYGFEVKDASERMSKNGNEMIKIELSIFNADGDERKITDYLMEALPHKLRHAADACGLIDNYEKGHLTADNFIGCMGDLKLKIEKDKTGAYPDKNAVADYVPKKTKAEKIVEDLDDGIPF